jgi:hypothetical protein
VTVRSDSSLLQTHDYQYNRNLSSLAVGLPALSATRNLTRDQIDEMTM